MRASISHLLLAKIGLSFLPYGLLYRIVYNMTTAFAKGTKKREREEGRKGGRGRQKGKSVLYTLVVEVTSYHFAIFYLLEAYR